MKRLLLGPALVLPLLTLGFCGKSPQLPKVPEVVREIPLDNFEQRFPPITTMPTPEPQPAAPAKKPVVKHRPNQVKKHVRPVPARRPPVVSHEAPPVAEDLPPQQGPICIFPLNMIPNCTPQVIP